jgi:hypothetical protein
MKTLILIALLAAAGGAMAETATWTGRQEQVVTVNGNMAYRCWYQTARGDTVTIVVRGSGCRQYADIN